MGRFTNILDKYKPVIENIMGNVNDIVVKDRYSDAVASLKKLEDAKKGYDQFQKLNRQVRGSALQPSDLYKPTNDFGFTADGKQLNNTNAAKEYYATLQPVETPNEDGTITQTMPVVNEEDFKKFVLSNPQHVQELKDLKYIQPKFQEVPEEEKKLLQYKKAGLTPEQIQFYEEFKKQNFDVTGHNQKIQNMILDKYPGLLSRGSSGDQFAKLFSSKAGMMGIDDGKNTKYSYMKLDNGKLLRYTDDGSYEIVDIGDVNDPKKKARLKDLSATELEKLSFEQLISGYAPEELFKSLYDFTPDIRTKLLEKYPEWKPEEDVLKTRGTGSKRYGSSRKEKDPLEVFLQQMSDIGLKNNGKEFAGWDDKSKKDYTDAMNSVRGLKPELSDQEIWDMVGGYEQNKYKTEGDNSRGKKSPYGNVINDDERYTINEVYYGTKYGSFNGQSLGDWVKTLDQTADRDTFYQWADDVRKKATQYVNDLGLTKNMANEILTDVENQIQRIKSQHQGW